MVNGEDRFDPNRAMDLVVVFRVEKSYRKRLRLERRGSSIPGSL